MSSYLRVLASVSIHTPIQGVTRYCLLSLLASAVSIHTPIQGVTAYVAKHGYHFTFQSTHPYRV